MTEDREYIETDVKVTGAVREAAPGECEGVFIVSGFSDLEQATEFLLRMRALIREHMGVSDRGALQ